MPSSHALLAPSAAHRWMECAPSARLEALEPEKDTVYTREGTIAHGVAEVLLTFYRDRHFLPADDVLKLAEAWRPEARPGKEYFRLQAEASELGLDFSEMVVTVHDNYVVPVYMDYLEAQKADPDAKLLVEQKIDLDVFIPEGFGSADAVIIAGKTLSVYDLKYGKGVKVDASFNPQIMCYGLGALIGAGETYNIEEVEMNIIQPRLKHFSTFLMDAAQLRQWGFKTLHPAAVKAFSGEGDLVPGAHCRFCAVAPRCKALAAMAHATKMRAGEPALMSVTELSAVLSEIGTIKTWATAVEAYALELALKGDRIPGFKLVEGRSVRKISDQDKAIEILTKAGFEEGSFLRPRELKTITDLEKLLRKKGFQELLGGLVEKPKGKPTLVEQDDPREEISSAEMDFDNIPIIS